MGKVLFGVVVALASLMLVDSLNCNSCPFGLLGFCFFPSSVTCTTNTSVCATSTATFPSLSSFKGFSTSSCLTSSASCNTTVSSTLLSVTYNTTVSCCSTNNCNSALSAAPSTRMTLSAVLGVAVVASVWGSML